MDPHGIDETGEPRVRVRPTATPVLQATSRAGEWAAPAPLSPPPRGGAPALGAVMAAAALRVHDRTPAGLPRVQCSGCGTEYGLPPGLVPPWGGRVRCPRCTAVFPVGVRAEADELVARVAGLDPAGWESALGDRSLWAMWGQELLEAYAVLRARHGAPVAARAFRRALEDAAPGVPWLAPPTPPSPLAPEAVAAGGTMFERRQTTT